MSIRTPDRKRPQVGKILLVAILVVVVGEPLFMYRSLMHQREERNAAREQPLEAPPGAPGNGG